MKQRALLCRAVFLDLNGALVRPLKVEHPTQHEIIPGAADAVAMLCAAGFVCPVVTVQSGIEKGRFSQPEFLDWFHSFRTEITASYGATLAGIYVCPHRYRNACTCKKAGGVLYREAAVELGIDLASSVVVGDSLEDMQAARSIRNIGVAVRTGWPLNASVEDLAAHVADDVQGAAEWIVNRLSSPR
jgi:histidinol-phosphate phosphatase family protein